ncbi:MAG: DUF92 domain-containing protein [Thermoproteota archaeon]
MTISNAVMKLLVIVLLAIATYASRSMTFSGILASVGIGVLVLFLGGWNPFIMLLSFLIIGVFFTKYKHKEKSPGTLAQEKGGVRTWVNVLANGGPAAIPVIFEYFYWMEFFSIFFLTAVCSATADTLATEIGLLSRSKPRLITNPWKKVEKGVSGGVTVVGTVAGLLGSFSLSLVAFLTCSAGVPGILLSIKSLLKMVLISSLGGFLGMIIDSLLGATVQAIYVSKADGMLYEDPRKCFGEAILVKGVRHIGNNAVNFISCLSAGLIGASIYFIM